MRLLFQQHPFRAGMLLGLVIFCALLTFGLIRGTLAPKTPRVAAALVNSPTDTPPTLDAPSPIPPTRTRVFTRTPVPSATARPTPAPTTLYSTVQQKWKQYQDKQLTEYQISSFFDSMQGQTQHWTAKVSTVQDDAAIGLEIPDDCFYCIVHLVGAPRSKLLTLKEGQTISFDARFWRWRFVTGLFGEDGYQWVLELVRFDE